MPESPRDELKSLLDDGPRDVQEATVLHQPPRRTFDHAFYGDPDGPFDWCDLHGPIPGVKPENFWAQYLEQTVETVEKAIANPDPEHK